MKGLIASIYQDSAIGNCSNYGISSKVKQVTIVGAGIPEIFEACETAPAVFVEKWYGDFKATPVEGKNTNATGWMFGGCFIYCSDSRFPAKHPIALHDRQEVA